MSMLQSKIEIFFGKFAIYIIGVLMFMAIGCGLGWYVSNIRLEAQTAKTESTYRQLEISNASYNSIKTEFSKLTGQLEQNQEKALASHAILQERLKEILEVDQSRVNMEKYLTNRQTETDCQMPKDLLDAWRKM